MCSACLLLLQVPTALLLLEQDHNHTQAVSPTSNSPVSLPAGKPKAQQADIPLLQQGVLKSVPSPHKTHIVFQLLCYTALFTLGLLFLSDMQLRHYPEHFTTSIFMAPVQGETPLPLGTTAPMHWMRHVYGYMLMVSHAAYIACAQHVFLNTMQPCLLQH